MLENAGLKSTCVLQKHPMMKYRLPGHELSRLTFIMCCIHMLVCMGHRFVAHLKYVIMRIVVQKLSQGCV